MSIRLAVLNEDRQHFVVTADSPVTVEVLVYDGRVLAQVYDTAPPSRNTEPIGAYDGSLPDNKDWAQL